MTLVKADVSNTWSSSRWVCLVEVSHNPAWSWKTERDWRRRRRAGNQRSCWPPHTPLSYPSLTCTKTSHNTHTQTVTHCCLQNHTSVNHIYSIIIIIEKKLLPDKSLWLTAHSFHKDYVLGFNRFMRKEVDWKGNLLFCVLYCERSSLFSRKKINSLGKSDGEWKSRNKNKK